MITRILLFLALAFGVFVTPSWAQACGGEEVNCFTFDATHTTFTYDNFPARARARRFRSIRKSSPKARYAPNTPQMAPAYAINMILRGTLAAHTVYRSRTRTIKG